MSGCYTEKLDWLNARLVPRLIDTNGFIFGEKRQNALHGHGARLAGVPLFPGAQVTPFGDHQPTVGVAALYQRFTTNEATNAQ